MLIDLAKAGPVVLVLAGIAEVLRDGEDPEWVVGGVTAAAAFSVAEEWLTADIEPNEVSDWLRAGCWDPRAARRMVTVGLRPVRLLDAAGRPAHWVETPSGERTSLALAVSDDWLSVEEAVRVVTR